MLFRSAAVNATARSGKATPVAVEHLGADRLGQRLALELKERMGASPLFILTTADTPKLKVVVRTTEEFPGRPGLGTAVSVTWVYSGGAGLLGADGELVLRAGKKRYCRVVAK